MTAGEIATKVAKKMQLNWPPDGIIVLTGGEPTLWNLSPLLEAMLPMFPATHSSPPIHIETAGHRSMGLAIRFPSPWVWLTVSPKHLGTPPCKDMIKDADQVKIVVERPSDISGCLNVMCYETAGLLTKTYWLIPEWSQRYEEPVLDAINAAIRGELWDGFDQLSHQALATISKVRFRAGLQTHKYLGTDLADADADDRDIPLGGDDARGPSR
jgi:organic radical activating enzyme